jgi:hypothetical protein
VLRLARTPVRLTPAEHAALRAAAERDAPAFAPRLDRPVDVVRLEQPWFRRHRVLELVSAAPPPDRRIHVAVGPTGTVLMFTAHIERLRQVAAEDPPPGLDERDAAADYATYGDFWTRVSALGELIVEAFDEIPWYPAPDAAQRERVALLRAAWAESITTQVCRRTDEGWSLRSWRLIERRLVERELVVPRDGQLRRRDATRATELPVPPGRYWKLVNGRGVPAG